MRAVDTMPFAQPLAVPAAYLPLHKYLDGRYADRVVLTFVDLEALLGFALPAAACLESEWWSNRDDEGVSSPHCGAWIHAHRTARPNLPARIVIFDRMSE